MIFTANLELWFGPAVPVKASREVMQAVQSVTVINSANGPDAFQISFEISNQSPLQTLFLLAGGAALPLLRMVIAVRVNGKRDILIDGVVTHQQIKESKTPGKSMLSVTGEDLTKVMDYIDFSFLQYPAMPDFARVTMILAKYSVLGIIPNDDAAPPATSGKRKKKSKADVQLDQGKECPAPTKKKKHDSLYQLQMGK